MPASLAAQGWLASVALLDLPGLIAPIDLPPPLRISRAARSTLDCFGLFSSPTDVTCAPECCSL
jgi:hypothetical protein